MKTLSRAHRGYLKAPPHKKKNKIKKTEQRTWKKKRAKNAKTKTLSEHAPTAILKYIYSLKMDENVIAMARSNDPFESFGNLPGKWPDMDTII